jgi:glycine/D-amino acid oxidase-like deaminating enzyme
MRVGVLGGGLQGCSAALALAERGAEVVLFDKNNALLSKTAVANEGKIHLGYMYAGDPTLSTAKTMMTGALSFAPFLEGFLGHLGRSFSVSIPATYWSTAIVSEAITWAVHLPSGLHSGGDRP